MARSCAIRRKVTPRCRRSCRTRSPNGVIGRRIAEPLPWTPSSVMPGRTQGPDLSNGCHDDAGSSLRNRYESGSNSLRSRINPRASCALAAAAMLGPRLGDGENPAPQRLGSEPPRHGGPQHTALALAAGAALALSGNHQETAITSAVAAFHEGDQGLMGFRLGVAVKVEAALDGKAATAKSPRGARVEPV